MSAPEVCERETKPPYAPPCTRTRSHRYPVRRTALTTSAPPVVGKKVAGDGVLGAAVDELLSLDGLVAPTSSTDEVSWLAHTVGGEVPEAYGPGGGLAWDRKPR